MSNIKGRQELLMLSLSKFYSREENIQLIIPIVKQQTSISLRLLDWLVTNFSREYDVNYRLSNSEKKNFSIWLDYKNQLKAYSKKQFDPFCRRNRIFYDIKNNMVYDVTKENKEKFEQNPNGFITTVGQLNFFRWAITYEVIDYAVDNLDAIESDMLSSADNRKQAMSDGLKRRRESSKTKKGMSKHDMLIVINFP